jgi:hypothetical protein
VSHRYHNGIVGTIDAVGGIFVGIAQGLICVFILLILLPLVLFAISPDIFISAIGILDDSFLAEALYLNNPLASLIDNFVPGLFDPGEWLGKAKSVIQ